MCRIMVNSVSRDLIFGLRSREEKLQRVQILTNKVKDSESEITKIDSKINSAENKIKIAENKIKIAEKIIKDNEALIASNEALIASNEVLIAGNEKSITLGEAIIANNEELIKCYKAIIANNEAAENGSVVDSVPSIKEIELSTTAYEKIKQNSTDSKLKTDKSLSRVVEKTPNTSVVQPDEEYKAKMTAYNILNDCFNNFRLKYLSSTHWF